MIDILGFTLEQLARTFARDYGKGRFHAQALYRDIFKQGNINFPASPEFLDSPGFAGVFGRKNQSSSGPGSKNL